jgi:protein O-GlcNAc transferase
MEKIGRNDLCPCGSGKKYKVCCLKKSTSQVTSLGSEKAPISVQLQIAVEHHQGGRLPQAEAICQRILRMEPNHADALHLLGVTSAQQGRTEIAVNLIRKAIKTNPSDPAYYRNLGNVLKDQGKLEEAIASYRQALSIKPDFAVAYVNLGNVLWDLGRPEEAEASYRTAVEIKPDFAEAYSNLGNALQDQGKLEEAIASYRQALSIKPDFAVAYVNLGNVLKDQGKLEEAIASYRQALSIKPDFAEAYRNLGNALQDQGKLEEAIASYRQALSIKPDFAVTYVNLGNVLWDLGRPEEAGASYRTAVEIKPDFAEAYRNLGNVLKDQGKVEEAIANYRQALSIKPDFAEAHSNLGNVLKDQGKLEEAIASYRQALSIKPDFAEAHSNLGSALKNLGRPEEAEASYRTAIGIKPDFAEAHSNLGNALQDQGKLEEAIASYRQALSIKPDFAVASANLGNVLKDQGKLEEAIASYRQALSIKPDFADAHSNLGNVLKDQGKLEEAIASYRQALSIKPDFAAVYSNLLFCMIHDEYFTPETCSAEHFAFAERFEHSLGVYRQAHTNDRNPDRHLKVGFVSGDLREHSVARFIEPVWIVLAQGAVDLWVYSNNRTEDAVSVRLRRLVRHWRVVAGLSDEELVETIRNDGIDILIDLSGHTAHNRLLTFAHKPAPVQATWIGYPSTTGLTAIDYVICDRFNAPHGLYERHYSEKFARLPTSGTFEPATTTQSVNELPALMNGYVTFASFNHASKLGESVIGVWSRILQALPNSRLLLGNISDATLLERLTTGFGRYGIAPERLDFRPRLPIDEYLALHHEADIVLDSWPYSGGTTTNYALWMGVPVVTLRGPSRASSQSAGILGRMGLEDWVARDVSEFVRIAVECAQDIETLASLRNGLRERSLNSPLRQSATVARGLEVALRVMWKRWCAGLPAAQFEIPMEAIEQGDVYA